MVTKHPAKKKTAPRKPKPTTERSLWEEIVEIGQRIPDAEIARHPADFVREYHHYKQGHNKNSRQ